MTGVAQESEDAWLLRFIDVTVEPGLSYKYQIRLKVANPNYRKPVKELAIPKFAEDQELESPWYQLPNFVENSLGRATSRTSVGLLSGPKWMT